MKTRILLLLVFLGFCRFSFGQVLEKMQIQVWWSSEYKPESKIWYTDPPNLDEIKCKPTPQTGIT